MGARMVINAEELRCWGGLSDWPLPGSQVPQWSDEYEANFLKLKALLTSAPILTFSVKDQEFRVYYDASGVVLGCVKFEHQRPGGLTQRLLILELIDQVFSLLIDPDCLYFTEVVSNLQLRGGQVVCSASIYHIRPQYSVHFAFLGSIKRELGTRVDLNKTFHPQTNGQLEMTIQLLEDMVRACVIDFRLQWDPSLALAEFSRQKSYADKKVGPLKFMIGDQIFPLVSPMKGEKRFKMKGDFGLRIRDPGVHDRKGLEIGRVVRALPMLKICLFLERKFLEPFGTV
ncbi:uncharacterized protein LOC129894719 [Solanum dulcamara]|uniref:uncharacterized protein LOC129894719 n=1 Tax=Solanum dulcamara TaxID=45834 RepID=UPI002484E4CF|nr:uncharacterized protein LOC129894719 [Solanum dulcamara]